MEERLEKQVKMIEALLEDKKDLSGKVDQLIDQIKDTERQLERQKTVIDDRLAVELKKNRDAWMASEKVRREKWEKAKIHEIRA